MTVKELLLQEIESLPDSLLTEALELMQKLKAKNNQNIARKPDNLGYPPDFFERTYGCLADDPLVRYPQGEPQERNRLKTKKSQTKLKTPEHLGYSPGFFEEVAGAWEGDLVRPEQGEI